MIANTFVQAYITRFTSTRQRGDNMPTPHLSSGITDIENRRLIEIPDIMEIKTTLFAIDSAKTPGLDGFGAGFFKKY